MGDRHQQLKRDLGLFGAVVVGLGSIIGTGVFVGIGIGAGVAGPAVLVAIALAAALATCNALSSAQLAAAHPVSGGSYEYGYRLLHPAAGFVAGWTFLCAKCASAATAALGSAGYALAMLGRDGTSQWTMPLALALTIFMTFVVLAGLRRSNIVNTIIVSIALGSLTLLVVWGLPTALDRGVDGLTPFWSAPPVEAASTDGGDRPQGALADLRALLTATALMFVAYTGYGRIATIGEEVREPRRIVPRAIIITLVVSALTYLAVAYVAIATIGAGALTGAADGTGTSSAPAAPLVAVADHLSAPTLATILEVGAIAAMLGVLLNLLLGLSRVVLAMGRRGDMPGVFARLDRKGATPWIAVVLVGLVICGLAAIGNVKTTWTFSAFTVLLYYGITNAAALRLPPEERLYPRWIAVVGLVGCGGLAFMVDVRIWIVGLAVVVVGLLWHMIAVRLRDR